MTKRELAMLADEAMEAGARRKRRGPHFKRHNEFARLVLGLRPRMCEGSRDCRERVSVAEQRRRGGALCTGHYSAQWQAALDAQGAPERVKALKARLRARLDPGPLYGALA